MINIIDELKNSASLNLIEQQQGPKFEYRISNTLKNISEKQNNLINSISKYFLNITSNCKSKILNDFNINKLCKLDVSIELKNLSNSQNYDLIVLARNNLKYVLFISCIIIY